MTYSLYICEKNKKNAWKAFMIGYVTSRAKFAISSEIFWFLYVIYTTEELGYVRFIFRRVLMMGN